MNKKQRNRKLVSQNKRNRMINRRYSSTIKTLFKLFSFKVKILSKKTSEESTPANEKESLLMLANNLYSIIDKAMKKQVIHKNTAARKKSRIGRVTSKLS